jgi:hypothetical protein
MWDAGISMDQTWWRIIRRLGSAKALKAALTDLSTIVGVSEAERTWSSLYQPGSDRGSPNHGNTPLSKRVISEIWSPASVRTKSPIAWKTSVFGSRTYTPKAGWVLARVSQSNRRRGDLLDEIRRRRQSRRRSSGCRHWPLDRLSVAAKDS